MESIIGNTKRYVDLFFKAADDVMPASSYFGQGPLNKEDLLRDMVRLAAEIEGPSPLPFLLSLRPSAFLL